MKMIDMSETRDKAMGMPEKLDKDKKYYPSFTSDKDLGMKMGQKVHMEGIVSGLRKDKYGNSTTIEVHKCGMMGKMSEDEFEKMSDEKQREHLEKSVKEKGGK